MKFYIFTHRIAPNLFAMKFRFLILFFILLTSTIVHSQLALDITTTDETCEGNGTVNPTVTNIAQGSTVKYTVVKLPELILIAQYDNSNDNLLTGLTSGDYRITATQTPGIASGINEIEKEFSIADGVVDLVFSAELTSTIDPCTAIETSKITVTTTSGTPVLYKLFKVTSSNPQVLVLVAQQPSNVFVITESAEYHIEVVDACGSSKAIDYTFAIGGGTVDFSIPVTVSPQVVLSCTDMKIEYILSDPTLTFPLDLTFTVHPPDGGAAQVTTINYPVGTTLPRSFTQILPIITDKISTYDIEIKGACSKIFNDTGTIDPTPSVTLTKVPATCGFFLTSTVSNFTPPYTPTFLSSPTGFNPVAFNPTFAGPQSTPGMIFGDIDHPVPYGTYKLQIVDNCGRIAFKELEIKKDSLIPIKVFSNNGCLDSERGKLAIRIPQNRKLISAMLIDVNPLSAHPTPLPENVSASINVGGVLSMVNLPLGTYTFDLIDECGSTYMAVAITIPSYVRKGFQKKSLPNCDINTGSIKLSSDDGKLTSVVVTSAPADFSQPLPYNATAIIDTAGNFYMNNLPAGTYEFSLKDICGYEENSILQVVEAYNGSSANIGFVFTPNCGTFNLLVNDSSNGTNQMAFWLQRKDPITGVWGHPGTGVAYTEGTVPNAINSVTVTEGSPLVNLTYTGDFRILKSFTSYNQGSANEFCVTDIGGFTFLGHLEIEDAKNLDCKGGSGVSSVVIIATGVPPLNYSITEKNGAPFFLNNGQNNTFDNLDPAVYKFEVQDACEKRPRIFDVRNLQPLVVANPVPEDQELLKCRTDDIKQDVFNLKSLDHYVLGNQNPEKYEITYHTNVTDADNGNAPILDPEHFLGTANQVIYARIYQKIINICRAYTPFKLYVGKVPVIGDIPLQHVCEDSTLEIGVEPGYSSYLWSTGEKTPKITVSETGVYHVDVRNNYGTTGVLFCSNSKDITVEKSSIAHFERFETVDWTEDENTITVIVTDTGTGIGHYEYSLDDVNYQSSNIFTGLGVGKFRVYIKDSFGCGKIFQDVVLLNYPKFFTPNGDGYNERWQIEYAALEPGLMVYVFDRYGKLITGLDFKNLGWDGTYDGNPLPSTDYWFVANRADGKVYKGHFAMKR